MGVLGEVSVLGGCVASMGEVILEDGSGASVLTIEFAFGGGRGCSTS